MKSNYFKQFKNLVPVRTEPINKKSHLNDDKSAVSSKRYYYRLVKFYAYFRKLKKQNYAYFRVLIMMDYAYYRNSDIIKIIFT